MVALTIALLAGFVQGPPTFNDILQHMHEDYRKLTGFRETWTLKTEEGDAGIVMIRTIDGPRFESTVTRGGQPVVESGYDGAQFYYVSYDDKIYDQKATKNSWIAEPFEAPQPATEPGYNFALTGGYDFTIGVSPTPVIRKVEETHLGSVPVRLVIGSVAVPDQPKPATIQMWFDRDRWVLRRVEARWKSTDGKSHYFVGSATVEHGAKIKDADFALDLTKVKGFTKKPLPGIDGS